LLFFTMVFIPCAMAQSKPFSSPLLNGFKDLLAGINGNFTFPDGFNEVKPPNDEKLPFQYGLKIPDADFEIWFQVNAVRADWQRFEKSGKQGQNPDSSYVKTAVDQAVTMAGANDYITRNMPAYVLNSYNADEGRSYLINLIDLPVTRHFQYALLIVLHKNHYGNIVVVCLTNDKGPSFFRNINKLRYCFKFNS
jgi:hypothetical protein